MEDNGRGSILATCVGCVFEGLTFEKSGKRRRARRLQSSQLAPAIVFRLDGWVRFRRDAVANAVRYLYHLDLCNGE
jgi:hypothetical protein